jgi:hypothetical protein
MQRSQSRENQNAATTRWIANATIALLPVLACFLGGATQKSEEGLVITLLALCLVVRPPRFSLGTLTNLVLLSLIFLAAVAFFPARWFFQPAWRAAVVNEVGLQLLSTLTPQPWITLNYLASFAVALSWFYVVSTQDLELREARFQLSLFSGGIALLAAICIALYLAQITLPFWHNEQNFGPFPNRNQTGDLFGLTTIIILACAQDDLRKKRKRWIVWTLAIALIVIAIVSNFSHSGIGILFAGSALWLGAFAIRQRSPSRLLLGVSFLLLLLTALLLFGGQTLERFHLRDFGSTGISTDSRWQIFHETPPRPITTALVMNFIARRCRMVASMMRFSPPVILANGRTHRPIFISRKRSVAPRNKIGNALGMPGWRFRPPRRQQRSRISARDRCSTFYFLFLSGGHLF